MSLRASARFPRTCSGEMYPAVPMTKTELDVPGCVTRPPRTAGFSIRAMPKSRILARPSLVRKMFSGLMSRWITPILCAASSPSAMRLAISVARGGARGPERRRSASVSPWSSSVTA